MTASAECEKLLLDDAKTMSYRDFEIVLRQFERLADRDGDFDGSWTTLRPDGTTV